MEFSNDDLKRAAASLAAHRAGTASGHPDVEALVAYHAGGLQDARTEEIQEHLVTCRRCGDLILELHRVEEQERRPWTRFTEWVAGITDSSRATASVPVREAEAASGGVLVWRRSALAGVAAALLLASGYFVSLGTRVELGSYEMDLRGEKQPLRGSDTSPADATFHFSEGMIFNLNLYPIDAVEGKVEAEAFLAGVGPWTVPIEISDEGAVRIAGRIGTDLPLPTGASTIYVVVARPGRGPGIDELQLRLADASVAQENAWTAWRISVVVDEQGASP